MKLITELEKSPRLSIRVYKDCEEKNSTTNAYIFHIICLSTFWTALVYVYMYIHVERSGKYVPWVQHLTGDWIKSSTKREWRKQKWEITEIRKSSRSECRLEFSSWKGWSNVKNSDWIKTHNGHYWSNHSDSCPDNHIIVFGGFQF